MKIVEPRTYRATTEAWIGQLALPLAFFTLLTITAVRYAGMEPWLGGLGMAGLAVVALFDLALPMLRNWLVLDDRSIEGVVNGRYVNLYWTEVIAAWLYQRRKCAFLCLGTRERTVVIPMRFFDADAVWAFTQAAVSPAALTEEALDRLPDFQNWQRTQREQRSQKKPPVVTVTTADGAKSGADAVVADHWMIQVAAWTGITCFMLGLLDAISAGRAVQAVLCGTLALVSGLLLVNWGLTEFTGSVVERFTLFGGWRIRWDCVRRAEVGLFGAVIVLVGEDCQLVIPGMGLWSGSARRRAQAVLLSELEKRGIPLRRTPWATFKFSRGSRIQK